MQSVTHTRHLQLARYMPSQKSASFRSLLLRVRVRVTVRAGVRVRVRFGGKG